tara:strand:- start:302 stop:472 length:171 start_codon:yes stop_codon:yes gene_type:complete
MSHQDIKTIFINFDYRELKVLPDMIKMGYIKTTDDQPESSITQTKTSVDESGTNLS